MDRCHWEICSGCRGYTPTLSEDILGFFVTTDSQGLGLTD